MVSNEELVDILAQVQGLTGWEYDTIRKLASDITFTRSGDAKAGQCEAIDWAERRAGLARELLLTLAPGRVGTVSNSTIAEECFQLADCLIALLREQQ